MFAKHTSIRAFKLLARISDGMWEGITWKEARRREQAALFQAFTSDAETFPHRYRVLGGGSWENLQEAMFI